MLCILYTLPPNDPILLLPPSFHKTTYTAGPIIVLGYIRCFHIYYISVEEWALLLPLLYEFWKDKSTVTKITQLLRNKIGIWTLIYSVLSIMCTNLFSFFFFFLYCLLFSPTQSVCELHLLKMTIYKWNVFGFSCLPSQMYLSFW